MTTRERCMALWKEYIKGDITLKELIAALKIIENEYQAG